jgi:hypothetical protein
MSGSSAQGGADTSVPSPRFANEFPLHGHASKAKKPGCFRAVCQPAEIPHDYRDNGLPTAAATLPLPQSPSQAPRPLWSALSRETQSPMPRTLPGRTDRARRSPLPGWQAPSGQPPHGQRRRRADARSADAARPGGPRDASSRHGTTLAAHDRVFKPSQVRPAFPTFAEACHGPGLSPTSAANPRGSERRSYPRQRGRERWRTERM